jgi:hypothetical protein
MGLKCGIIGITNSVKLLCSIVCQKQKHRLPILLSVQENQI